MYINRYCVLGSILLQILCTYFSTFKGPISWRYSTTMQWIYVSFYGPTLVLCNGSIYVHSTELFCYLPMKLFMSTSMKLFCYYAMDLFMFFLWTYFATFLCIYFAAVQWTYLCAHITTNFATFLCTYLCTLLNIFCKILFYKIVCFLGGHPSKY